MRIVRFLAVVLAVATVAAPAPAFAQDNANARLEGRWRIPLEVIEGRGTPDPSHADYEIGWSFRPVCLVGACDVLADEGFQRDDPASPDTMTRTGASYRLETLTYPTGGSGDSCAGKGEPTRIIEFTVTGSVMRDGAPIATTIQGTMEDFLVSFDGTGPTCISEADLRVAYAFTGERVDLQDPVTNLPGPGPLQGGPRADPVEAFRASQPHRSVLAGATRPPDAVSFAPADLAVSALLTVVLMVLVVFPSALFNSTLRANYAEVRAWFSWLPWTKGGEREALSRGWPAFVGFLAVSALLYGLLDPGFGFDRSSFVTFVSILAALTAVTMLSALPRRAYMGKRYSDRGYPRVFLGTIAVAVVCVLVSRITDFQPGYLYGLAAGFAFSASLTSDDEGRTTRNGFAWMMGVGALAWLLWLPVRSAASDPEAGVVVGLIEGILVAIFVAGFQGALFGLIPLRFMPGESLFSWSRTWWLALTGLVGFTFIHVILDPVWGPGGTATRSPAKTVLGLFVAFGVASVLFWARFRFRKTPGASDPEMATSEDV